MHWKTFKTPKKVTGTRPVRKSTGTFTSPAYAATNASKIKWVKVSKKLKNVKR